jgi:hypothetical protein
VLTLTDFDLSEHSDGEHILPAFLGGNLKSKRVISPQANTQTGHLEKALEIAFKNMPAIFRITNERYRRDFKKIEFTSTPGEKFLWEPAKSQISLRSRKIDVTTDEDGNHRVHMRIPASGDEAKDLAEPIFIAKTTVGRKLGKHVDDIKVTVNQFSIKRAPAPWVPVEAEFDLDALRGVVKTGFLFAAHQIGAEKFLSKDYDFLRKIVMGQRIPFDAIWMSPPGSSKLFLDVEPPNHIVGTFTRATRLWACVAYFSGFIFLIDLGPLPDGVISPDCTSIFDPIKFTVREDKGINLSQRIAEHIPDMPNDQRLASPEDHEVSGNRVFKTWETKFSMLPPVTE